MSTERTQQHIYELNTEARITKLESISEMILKSLISIDSKLDKLSTDVNQKIDKMSIDINQKMDNGFKDINNRIWFNFYWTVGSFAGLLTVMAKGFEWF